MVGIVFESFGTSAMELAASARRVADVIWITGWQDEADPIPPRLLSRLGTVVDVSDSGPDGTIARLAELGVGGLVAFTDDAIPIVAQLGIGLGVPHNPAEVAVSLVDKVAQRRRISAAGLRSPRFAAVDRAEPAAALALVGLPAVLKPRRGAGATWTTLIDSEESLALALAAARPDIRFTLEEYLSGTEDDGRPWSDVVSVESVVAAGEVHNLATTGRFAFAQPFRETGLFLPSALSGSDLAAVLELVTSTLQALGVQLGAYHTEVKLTPDGPALIEVNGRPGGGVHRLIELVGGPSLIADAIRVVLGIPVRSGAWTPSGVAYLQWKLPPLSVSRVNSVDGLQQVGALPGVQAVDLMRQPGPIEPIADGARARLVSVEGTVDSHAELVEVHRRIDETIVVEYG